MVKASTLVRLALAGLVLARSAGAQAPEYKIIVNAANPVTTLSREHVTRIFLKKVSTWPNGQPAAPVDLRSGSPTRRAFSRVVLGKDPAEVAAYWNQLIFSGRGLPPPTKSSDSEVLAYVRDNPNAVGYVAADARIGEGVKVVAVKE
jgi:ABC-type phosphate transport system substrate-binding protein